MTNLEKLQKNLLDGKTVFIHDDYENAVIKVQPDETVFLKMKGKPEREISSTSKIVFDIELGGEFVDEDFYDLF